MKILTTGLPLRVPLRAPCFNTPNDDTITLKGTHAPGYAKASENITITISMVSGYDVGTGLPQYHHVTGFVAPLFLRI
jgi:hypothetical protein